MQSATSSHTRLVANLLAAREAGFGLCRLLEAAKSYIPSHDSVLRKQIELALEDWVALFGAGREVRVIPEEPPVRKDLGRREVSIE